MKYTIKNLKNDFPTDEACLDFIFKNRWPKGLTCPNCDKKDFYHVKGRKSYACKCGYQVSPTKGTIFHKSNTPLTLWFHAIFLMSQSKNGVAAKELERQLGVTYKCAWRMAKQIRLLLGDGVSIESDGDHKNGEALAKKYSTAKGAAKQGPKSKRDLMQDQLDAMGSPNFNDDTVSVYVGSVSSYGPDEYRLTATFLLNRERFDLMKKLKVDPTIVLRDLDEWLEKKFGMTPWGRKEYSVGRAKKQGAPYKYSITFSDPRLAYALGANIGYERGNTLSKNAADVKKKYKAYETMTNWLDNFKKKASEDIDSRTDDKEERQKIWQDEYMQDYIKMSDKFKKKGYQHPSIGGHR